VLFDPHPENPRAVAAAMMLSRHFDMGELCDFSSTWQNIIRET